MMRDPNPAPFVHLRLSLDEALPAPVWPGDVALASFSPSDHAHAMHALLADAYALGGGGVPPFQTWWDNMRLDSEYDPRAVFIALDPQERVIGAAHCWTSAFLKDLAVAADWRRKGLGKALVLQAAGYFRSRGVERLDLKADTGNPSGALHLYASLGMLRVGAGSA